MRRISLHHDPNREYLADLGVYNWPIETVEVSEFPMHYEEKETCFLIEGEAIVSVENDDPARIVSAVCGNLVEVYARSKLMSTGVPGIPRDGPNARR